MVVPEHRWHGLATNLIKRASEMANSGIPGSALEENACRVVHMIVSARPIRKRLFPF